MSAADEDRARAGVLRFLAALSPPREADGALLARGGAARLLAASKPGGLMLNVGPPELAFFIADGMDITSQLISVTSDPEVHAALKAALRDDIRISVHAQHPLEFLSDVRDHRFDLMTFGGLEPAAVRLAAASLAPGGLLAVFSAQDAGGGALREALGEALSECGTVIAWQGLPALLAARSAGPRRMKRRGGRRARPPVHR